MAARTRGPSSRSERRAWSLSMRGTVGAECRPSSRPRAGRVWGPCCPPERSIICPANPPSSTGVGGTPLRASVHAICSSTRCSDSLGGLARSLALASSNASVSRRLSIGVAGRGRLVGAAGTGGTMPARARPTGRSIAVDATSPAVVAAARRKAPRHLRPGWGEAGPQASRSGGSVTPPLYRGGNRNCKRAAHPGALAMVSAGRDSSSRSGSWSAGGLSSQRCIWGPDRTGTGGRSTVPSRRHTRADEDESRHPIAWTGGRVIMNEYRLPTRWRLGACGRGYPPQRV